MVFENLLTMSLDLINILNEIILCIMVQSLLCSFYLSERGFDGVRVNMAHLVVSRVLFEN